MEKLTPFYEILININLQTLVDVCGYEFPTNSQNFMQKNSEVKIFQKVSGELIFETPYMLSFPR